MAWSVCMAQICGPKIGWLIPNKTSKYPKTKMVPVSKAPGCQQHGVCPPQTLLVWHFGGWEKKRHHPAVLASIVHQLLPPVAQGKATWYARFKWKRLNPALQIVGASGSGELILMDHILDLQLVSGSQPCTDLQIRIFRSPAMMNAYLKISKWMQTPVATSQCWKEVAWKDLSNTGPRVQVTWNNPAVIYIYLPDYLRNISYMYIWSPPWYPLTSHCNRSYSRGLPTLSLSFGSRFPFAISAPEPLGWNTHSTHKELRTHFLGIGWCLVDPCYPCYPCYPWYPWSVPLPNSLTYPHLSIIILFAGCSNQSLQITAEIPRIC